MAVQWRREVAEGKAEMPGGVESMRDMSSDCRLWKDKVLAGGLRKGSFLSLHDL